MQRAIPQRRAVLALLAIVAAVATTPFAGATHVAAKRVKQATWFPLSCWRVTGGGHTLRPPLHQLRDSEPNAIPRGRVPLLLEHSQRVLPVHLSLRAETGLLKHFRGGCGGLSSFIDRVSARQHFEEGSHRAGRFVESTRGSECKRVGSIGRRQ